MRTKTVLANTVAMILFGTFLVACGGKNDGGEMKEVTRQRVGEYVVIALEGDGKLQEGTNDLVLEFRKASDNQLADVGPVQINSSMPMPGMSPMVAQMSATPSGTPGRYTVPSTFEMRGDYGTTVNFASGQRAQLSLKVQ